MRRDFESVLLLRSYFVKALNTKGHPILLSKRDARPLIKHKHSSKGTIKRLRFIALDIRLVITIGNQRPKILFTILVMTNRPFIFI